MLIFLSLSALKNTLLLALHLPALPCDEANVSMPGGPHCSPPKSADGEAYWARGRTTSRSHSGKHSLSQPIWAPMSLSWLKPKGVLRLKSLSDTEGWCRIIFWLRSSFAGIVCLYRSITWNFTLTSVRFHRNGFCEPSSVGLGIIIGDKWDANPFNVPSFLKSLFIFHLTQLHNIFSTAETWRKAVMIKTNIYRDT